MTTGVASACPQCGAPLRFGGAQSLAAVCAYCRSAVARKGVNLELVGKVPDLVATDTRLSIGTIGHLGNGKSQFQILGRLQLDQGQGTWNEWYAAVNDGTWIWLAEAQGRLYLTRPISDWPDLPDFDTLAPGHRIKIPAIGTGAVEEVNTATLVSMEGDLPFSIARTHSLSYRFADISTDQGSFITLDYGEPGDPVRAYAGRQATYPELGLGDKAPPAVAGSAQARVIDCPNCGGQLPLKLAETHTLTCPSCRALLDLENQHLRVIEVLGQRPPPTIPLGAKGTLLGESLEVIGAVKRKVEVEGIPYLWEELLLFGKTGYTWLSVYEGHWVLLRPVPTGTVHVGMPRGLRAFVRPWPIQWEKPSGVPAHEDLTFKEYQSAVAEYIDIQGEFYWQIRKGESTRVADYIAPPFMLSCEHTENEVAWTLGTSITGREIWNAFKLSGEPPRQVGVGAAQPNPLADKLRPLWSVATVACGVLLLLALMMGARSRTSLMSIEVPLSSTQANVVTVSPPFDVTRGPQALEVIAYADLKQSWIDLDVALINDDTAESEATVLDLSDYSGVDFGESWHERKATGKATIGSVHSGRYVLRVEPLVEPYSRGSVPAFATVRIERGVFLAAPLVLTLLLILAWPLFQTWRKMRFERMRWENSDHSPVPEFLRQMINDDV